MLKNASLGGPRSACLDASVWTRFVGHAAAISLPRVNGFALLRVSADRHVLLHVTGSVLLGAGVL